MAKGWLIKAPRKKGNVWLYNRYTTRHRDGKRVQSTVTIGLVRAFPRESNVWDEVKRRHLLAEAGTEATSRLTFNVLAKSYRDVELVNRAKTTQELHDIVLNKYILARWGPRFVEEIRVLELKNWFRVYLADEKQLAKATIQKIKAVMQRLYSYGRENELLPSNLDPLRNVKLSGIGRNGKSKKIVVPPSLSWQIANSLPPMAKAIVLIAAVSGLRVSEILGLHWSDVDLVVKKITLNSTWHSGGIIGTGKTEASKEPAFMSDKVVQALLDWKRITPYGADSDWVFASLKLKGKTPISGSQFVKDWLRPQFVAFGVIDTAYRGRAGLHAFRASLASWLITEEGIDPKTTQGVLRHANSAVTMNVYTHANEKGMRDAVDRMDSRMVV